jgi:predicted 3-demethylubiquinone-9 3-methyltransferase (glyoxalase superfamily)
MTMKQKIIPNLWFDDRAEEAATFYTSLFGRSGITTITRFHEAGEEVHGQPAGSVSTVEFELAGYGMVALNGGPHFSFTPAISFFVVCESRGEIDELWRRLSDGGEVMMPLDAYDWSERYGWVQDRYGLTWQLSLGGLSDVGQKITPSLLFVGDRFGRAEEAIELYTSVFADSEVAGILRYQAGEMGREGTVKHAQFTLDGEVFMVMDGPGEHPFSFNEAVSFIVPCATQEEIDHYWEKLSEGGDPSAQQCGWLKDRFGVSWQVVPLRLYAMLQDSDAERVGRVTRAFLRMKKLDLAALERAYQGVETGPQPRGGTV